MLKKNKHPQTNKTCCILLPYLQSFLIIRTKEFKALVDFHTFPPILSHIEFCNKKVVAVMFHFS